MYLHKGRGKGVGLWRVLLVSAVSAWGHYCYAHTGFPEIELLALGGDALFHVLHNDYKKCLLLVFHDPALSRI